MRNERTTIWKMVRALNDRESNGGFWLPNIQRPFVWSESQIERLFDSIMREYPISTLLVWRTKSPIKHRKFIDHWKDDVRLSSAFVTENTEAKGLVLDGQQRLQSLIIGILGSYNGRELCLDLTSGGAASPDDIRYQFRFLGSPAIAWPWVKFGGLLRDLSRGHKLPMEVAGDVLRSCPASLPEERSMQVQKNVARAQYEFIVDENLSYQLLDSVDDPSAYTPEDVVEIFIRANAGGTKLGKSDLMFSLLASEWSFADEELEELLGELNKTGYAFDRDFVLKSCLVMLGKGAKYEVSKFRDPSIREQFVSKWSELSNAIKGVRDFLYGRTFLRSDKAVPSYLALIPLIFFRYKFPERWESASSREEYILRTMLTGAFSGTPDNLIDRCTREIERRGDFVLADLYHVIRSDGRSLEVTGETILGARYGKPLSHLLFNIWYRDFDYEPALSDNLPQQDHLFPQSLLKQQRETNPDTGRSRQRYSGEDRDQIANLALLTARENGFQGKSGTALSEWLPEKLGSDPEFLKRHLIPADPTLWSIERFPDFIEARKRLILDHFAAYLQSPAIDQADDLADESDFGEERTSEALKARQEIMSRFWSRLIERSKTRGAILANRTAPTANWIGAPIGRAGFRLHIVLTESAAMVDCYIRIDSADDKANKIAFRRLMQDRESIEQTFGGPLEWDELPHRTGARVCKRIAGGWRLSEAEWPRLQDELIDILGRLENALRDRVQALAFAPAPTVVG